MTAWSRKARSKGQFGVGKHQAADSRLVATDESDSRAGVQYRQQQEGRRMDALPVSGRQARGQSGGIGDQQWGTLGAQGGMQPQQALRTRIGHEPLRDLVQRCCVPLANVRTHPEAFYGGLRLVAMDGSPFEQPDEADNDTAFGYPGSGTGHAGYPQAQCVV